jgi:hypothetical protein
MKTIYNFNDESVFKSLEKQCYDGSLDVSDFPPAEYKYFSELRKIYYAFKFEGLDKDNAERKKALLYREYQRNVSESDYSLQLHKVYQDNIRSACTLLSDIEKSKDTETIALLACKAIQCMTGEYSFADRQAKKIKG